MKTGTPTHPITREEADQLLSQATKDYREFLEDPLANPNFTCSTCFNIAWCEFAYDSYNLNG